MSAMETASPSEATRCSWADDTELIRYHDEEWGIKPESDSEWFEKIVLETFQAGLSWKTILHKRDNFRAAFFNFQPERVAELSEEDVIQLLQNEGIIRHRKKIEATIANAKIAVDLVHKWGSLAQFFDPLMTEPRADVLALLQSSFRFVGRTTAESIAFATGLLSAPHEQQCWKYHRGGGSGS